MIKYFITIALALHFLSDPVGQVQQGVDIGAPIVVAFFDNDLIPAVRLVNRDAEAMKRTNHKNPIR